MRQFINIIENTEVEYPSVEVALGLLPLISRAAQNIYDAWGEGDLSSGIFGSGGICELIAHEIHNIIPTDTFIVSDEDASHSYVVAAFAEGTYRIDIPFEVYEVKTPDGFIKKDGVVFGPDSITVDKISNDPDYAAVLGSDDEEWV